VILGTGIDSVEINRFNLWHTFSYKQLQRIFSDEEITYCLQQPNKSAERFAVRFAAREAFYKALCIACPTLSLPFLTLCKNSIITKNNGRPIFFYKKIATIFGSSTIKIHISMTHTKTLATAYIILESLK
jgi:holo-[acyl-carrier protein] synthase